MFLRASPSTVFSLSTAAIVDDANQFPSSSSSSSQRRIRRTDNGLFVMMMSVSKNESNNPSSLVSTGGFVFEPFEEVKKELELVPYLLQQSLARHKFSNDCEAAINYHINWEYNVSYVYHALYAYYDRDNIALRGFAKFFMEASLEERKHAELLMEYQNTRGGQVELEKMLMPEFYPPEIGEASYAMELALSIAKITNNKLLQLHSVAVENDDAQLADFIESTFLTEQEETIKKISKFVALLRRIGEGHGVWHFDRILLNA